MPRPTRGLLACLSAALGLTAGACVEMPGEGSPCGPGELVEVGGEALCVFTHPVIIETGFTCPAEYPYAFEVDGVSVCADSPELTPDVYEGLLPLGPTEAPTEPAPTAPDDGESGDSGDSSATDGGEAGDEPAPDIGDAPSDEGEEDGEDDDGDDDRRGNGPPEHAQGNPPDHAGVPGPPDHAQGNGPPDDDGDDDDD